MAKKINAINESNKGKANLTNAPNGCESLRTLFLFSSIPKNSQALSSPHPFLQLPDDVNMNNVSVVANLTGIDYDNYEHFGLVVDAKIATYEGKNYIFFLINNTGSVDVDTDKLYISYATIRHI